MSKITHKLLYKGKFTGNKWKVQGRFSTLAEAKEAMRKEKTIFEPRRMKNLMKGKPAHYTKKQWAAEFKSTWKIAKVV